MGERKRKLHRAIAEHLEATSAARPAEQFGRLAHHYTEAGLTEQAVDYWRRAGQRAIEQLGERRGGRQLAPVSMRSSEYRRRS